MKRALSMAALIATVSVGVASAQVSGTDHDMSTNEPTGQICIFCHTPHNASPAVPLWNHTLPTASYTEYASPTMDSASAGPLQNGTGVSNLCLSCHDGTVGLGDLVNNGPAGPPTNAGTLIGGPGLLGTDLSNDHPINIIYDEAVDAELVARATVVLTLDLFGTGADELQCATCHDPHNDNNQPFLVIANTNSALCTTCHIK